MRLVDVDTITEETFKAYVGENGGFISFGDAVDAIKATPTAYDVDKVISEIDKCAIDNTDWGYSANPKLASYYLSRTAEVIDIVKRGGTE